MYIRSGIAYILLKYAQYANILAVIIRLDININKMDNIQKISTTLSETIKVGEFQSVTSDIAEVLIDGALTDGILKDLPLIRLLVGLVKTSVNVKDKLFIKKLITFLTQLNEIPADKRKELMDAIDNSQKYRTKVGEKLLYIIDKCYDNEKAEILGKLFNAYLAEKINYDDFLRAATCVENVFIPDLLKFVDARWDDFNVEEDAESLLTAGLVNLRQIEPSIDEKTQEIENSELKFKITKIGETIREILTTKPFRRLLSLF